MVASLQELFICLNNFWSKEGCALIESYDIEKGAGTFNPETFLRAIGPEPFRAAYVEACRRPTDGRYGMNPNRVHHYFQYQVILKPSPLNIQDLCLDSLRALGFNLEEHDIRFVHDDWESPTLGAWGLGWEVWMDGMEVLQFTYFQACGSLPLKPVLGEVTYGTERLLMALLRKKSIFELPYNSKLTYGDLFYESERQWSRYNFEVASVSMWQSHFDAVEKEAKRLILDNLPLVAYDFVLKASHAFNLLDARGAISVTERTGYIARIRDLAKGVAEEHLKKREELGFPLIQKKEAKETAQLSVPQALQTLLGIEDFLLEIGTEELPAAFVDIAQIGIEKGFRQFLKQHEISCGELEIFATPRRIALLARGLAFGTTPSMIEKRGPKALLAFDDMGKMTAVGKGFLAPLGILEATLSEIRAHRFEGVSIVEHKGEEYIYLKREQKAKPVAALLQEALPKIILSIDFPKKMRWSDLDIEFARPLRWIVSLWGRHVLPFILGDVVASNIKQKQKQKKKGPVVIEIAGSYEERLLLHEVMVSASKRREKILQDLQALEQKNHFKAVEPERVLKTVVNLVEMPELAIASFKPEFLSVPKEILISEMVEHQKYFPLQSRDGTFLPNFIITADNVPNSIVIEGNERVLSARLSDGHFLFDEDIKTSLDAFNSRLSDVIFQKELGTIAQKVERLRALSKKVQKHLGISSEEQTALAAKYAKADLVSKVVYEFPDLQGIMGRIYLEHKNGDSESAQAIEQHWWPTGENRPLPTNPTADVVALADKIDNLNSYFRVGLIPSSSSDPYGLRRQLIGIIRILLEKKYFLSISEFFETPEVLLFILNRFRAYLLEKGEFHKEEIEAILSWAKNDIYDSYLRLCALSSFRKSDAGYLKLLEIFKRVDGLLEKGTPTPVNPDLFEEPSEKIFFEAIKKNEPFLKAIKCKDYVAAFQWIADLQAPLSRLFVEVKIMDARKNIADNRLALLAEIRDLLSQLFDFKKLVAG